MVGVTLYVSITTEESVKIDQDYPVMKCSYGYSFLCAVLSFILQELTGVLTVYWFIYRFRALVRRQEKLRERTRQLMGNCLSMTTTLPFNLAYLSQNHLVKSTINRSNQNHTPYQTTSNDVSNPLIYKQQQQQRRHIPFDKLVSSSSSQQTDKIDHPSYSPPLRSPTLTYGDYCRVLIRAEDMDLLVQMVKSKSQAHLLTNSKPATPTSIISTKNSSNMHKSRQNNDNSAQRNTRKNTKRTTSV